MSFKALCYTWLLLAIVGTLFDQTMLLEDQQHKANTGGFFSPSVSTQQPNPGLESYSSVLSSSVSLLNLATAAFTSNFGYLVAIMLPDKHALIWFAVF